MAGVQRARTSASQGASSEARTDAIEASDPTDAQVEDRQAIRTFRTLVRELLLPVPANTPLDLLPGIASKLGVSPAAEQEARTLLEELDPVTASGKNPAGLVAAALYLASLETDHRFTQEAVAETVGVTAVTLRARVQDLDA